MPQSLSRVLIHLVFSTKNRAPSLLPSVQTELHAYLAGVLKGVDCPTLQAGGVDDHVHLLFGLSRTRSTSEVVEMVKTSSSKMDQNQGRAIRRISLAGRLWGVLGESVRSRNRRYLHQKPGKAPSEDDISRRIPALSGTSSGPPTTSVMSGTEDLYRPFRPGIAS